MPDASFTQTSFLGGEWSPYMQGRFDRPDYRTALNVCLNGLPLEEGSWTRRPGTRRLAPTRGGVRAVLREFHFSQSSPYLMEFTGGHVRFYSGGQLVIDTLAQVATVTTANPAVCRTEAPHGWSTGDQVQFQPPASTAVPGAAALLGRQFAITVLDTHRFSLTDPVTGASFNGSGIDLGANSFLVGRILDIATPYEDSESVLQSLRIVQGQDKDGSNVALILRSSHAPRELAVTRLPTDCRGAGFAISTAGFLDGPYMDPIADGTTVSLSGTTGSVTLTATPGALTLKPAFPGFASTDVGRLLRLHSEPATWSSATAYSLGDHVKFQDTYWTANIANTGKQPDLDPVTWSIDPAASRWTWAEITAYTSANVVTVSIRGSDLLYSLPVAEWRMGLYSETTGWPTCGAFHEGRLWLSGAQDNRFDASKSNDFFNFAPTEEDGTVADDNAIAYVLNSKDVNPIFWLEPGDNGLVMGTQAGEWIIRASSLQDPITPTSIQAIRPTKYGCANIEPRRTGLSLTFVQRYNENVIEYVSDPQPGKFSGQKMSMKAKHLTHVGVAELAYVELTTPILWARTTDGSLIGCTYKRDNPYGTEPESFSGWHRHTLGSDADYVFSIQAGPSADGTIDALSMVVRDADSVYYVDLLTPIFEEDQDITEAWFLDGAKVPATAQVVAGSPDVVRLYGLSYLEGKLVQAFAAGVAVGDFTVLNGYIDVPVDATGSLFTSQHLQSLTDSGSDFGGLGVIVQRASTGSIPTPVSANLVNYYKPGFPDVSTGGVAIDWSGDTIWLTNQGNGATDSILKYGLNAAQDATVTKTVVDIFGSSGGNNQFIQSPIGYTATSGELFWQCSSDNTGRVIRYDPAAGTSSTLGTGNASLNASSAHLPKPLSMSPLSAGDDYMVMCSLVGEGGVSGVCSVCVVDTTDMTLPFIKYLDERFGVTCRGPWASKDCYVSGTSYILGGPKLSLTTYDAQSLQLYSVVVQEWEGDPTCDLSSIGTISPSQVNANWTHWDSIVGMVFDNSDNNVIFGVSISDPPAWNGGNTYSYANMVVLGSDNHVYKNLAEPNIGNDPTTDAGVHWADLGAKAYTSGDARLVKVSTKDASVMWTVAVDSIPSSQDDWNQCRIQNGKFAYIDGSGTGHLYVITTSTGASVKTTLTGITKGGPVVYDDLTGRIVLYLSAFANTGSIQPKGATPTSFTAHWATLDSSGAVVHNTYFAPFIVGYTYTSDGQIVRSIHPAEAGAANGPALAKTRRAHMMAAVLHKAQGVSFGTVFTSLNAASLANARGTALTALELYSGTYWNTLADDYSFDSMLCWRVTQPYPATVLAVGTFLHTQDR